MELPCNLKRLHSSAHPTIQALAADQADVAVRRDIETAIPVATFQVAQKYNNKMLAVWRLPLGQFI